MHRGLSEIGNHTIQGALQPMHRVAAAEHSLTVCRPGGDCRTDGYSRGSAQRDRKRPYFLRYFRRWLLFGRRADAAGLSEGVA